MMSVKHITISGEEFLYLTRVVNYVPAAAKLCAPAKDSLWIERDDGARHEIDNGTVFVMNEHGKTVSRYDLSASPVPLEATGGIAGWQRSLGRVAA